MAFQKEAEPEIVGFSFVLSSERYTDSVCRGTYTLQNGYTKVSMTTYTTCALGQYTEEGEEDGENRCLAVFCV